MQFDGDSFAGDTNQARLVDSSALDETRDILLKAAGKQTMKDRRQPYAFTQSQSYAP